MSQSLELGIIVAWMSNAGLFNGDNDNISLLWWELNKVMQVEWLAQTDT